MPSFIFVAEQCAMTNKLQSKVGLTAGIVLYLHTGIVGTTSAQSYVGIDLYLIQSPSGDQVNFPSGFAKSPRAGKSLASGIPAPGGDGQHWRITALDSTSRRCSLT